MLALSGLHDDCQRYLGGLGPAKRVLFLTCVSILAGLLVAAVVVGYFDETRIVYHLLVVALIELVLYGIFRLQIFGLKRVLVVGGHGSWSFLLLFGLWYGISWIPFEGITKAITNSWCLFAFGHLVALPFAGSCFPGIHIAACMVIVLVATTLEAIHWLPGSLALVLLTPILAFRVLPDAEPIPIADEAKRGGKQMSLTYRTIVSFASLLIAGLLIVGAVHWTILSMNYFWAHAQEVSKYDVLHRFPPAVNLNVHQVRTVADLEPYRTMAVPVVIKPNVCSTSSKNVKICRNYSCLKDYLEDAGDWLSDPKDRAKLSWIIQDYCPRQEACVFYYKYPYAKHGHIRDVGLRREAFKRSGQYLQHDYTPAEYRKASPAMTAFFDEILGKVPGCSGGLFDVMIDDWEEAQAHGTGIHVMDANIFPMEGISENITPTTPAHVAITLAFPRIRSMVMELWFGVYNILAGHQRSLFIIVGKLPKLVDRYRICHRKIEHLFAFP